MQKLSSRQIIQLHAMNQMGALNVEIASTLGVHRNTVSYHLNGEFEYEPHIEYQLNRPAPLITRGWMTLQDAARIMPGHPSRPKMQSLIKGRLSHDASRFITLKSEIHKERRMTKASWVRTWCKRVFPSGLWASIYWAEGVIPLSLIRQIEWLKIGIIGEPIVACFMPDLIRVAGSEYRPSARDIHRASAMIDATGVCVL